MFSNARCIPGDTCLNFHHGYSNCLFQARKNKRVHIQWAWAACKNSSAGEQDVEQDVAQQLQWWPAMEIVTLYFLFFSHILLLQLMQHSQLVGTAELSRASPALSLINTKPFHSYVCYDTAGPECFHFNLSWPPSLLYTPVFAITLATCICCHMAPWGHVQYWHDLLDFPFF